MKKFIVFTFFGIALSACSGGGGAGAPGNAEAGENSTQVMTGILFEDFVSENIDGVAIVSCPVDQTVVSASCFCGVGSGPIFGSETLGNGAACGCFVGPGPDQPVRVIAKCVKGTFSDALTASSIQKPIGGSLPSEETIQEWKDELKAIEARFQEIRVFNF